MLVAAFLHIPTVVLEPNAKPGFTNRVLKPFVRHAACSYEETRREYAERRDVMMRVLGEAGFVAEAPQGAYYVMADASALGFDDDVAGARYLVSEVGVAAVPGSSFFSRPELGSHLLRFAFPKQLATLEEAGRRLRGAGRRRTQS